MGPRAWAMTSRWRARRGPVASRSHTPPPKSAPPNSMYPLSASPRHAATISARLSSGTGHPRRRVSPGPFDGLGAADDLTVQQPHHDDAQEAVEQAEEQERHHQARHRGHRVGGPEHAMN